MNLCALGSLQLVLWNRAFFNTLFFSAFFLGGGFAYGPWISTDSVYTKQFHGILANPFGKSMFR